MKSKPFDCVRMKREIQTRILEEMEGLSDEERRRLTEERILADPVLGPFWRRACRVRTARRGTVDETGMQAGGASA